MAQATTQQKDPKTIVMVDDNLDLTRAYQQLLELEGYHVLLAGSGPDALELLSKIDPPDLLLVDCMMPGMSGAEFLRELHSKNPLFSKKTAIVGLSCLFGDSPPLKEMEPLVSRLAEKPVDITSFLKMIEESIC